MKNLSKVGLLLALAINATTSYAEEQWITFENVTKVSVGMLKRNIGSQYAVHILGRANFSGPAFNVGAADIDLVISAIPATNYATGAASLPPNNLLTMTVDQCAKAAHLARLNPSQNQLQIVARQSATSLRTSIRNSGAMYSIVLTPFFTNYQFPTDPIVAIGASLAEGSYFDYSNDWYGFDCGVHTPTR